MPSLRESFLNIVERYQKEEMQDIPLEDLSNELPSFELFRREVNRFSRLNQEDTTTLFQVLKIGNEADSIYKQNDYPQSDENEILEKINEGQVAKKILINSNIPLVIHIAKKFLKSAEFLDLIQQGCEGLIKAVDKFDLSKNTKFSTYATFWIYAAINRMANKELCDIDTPQRAFYRAKHYQAKFTELKTKLGRTPEEEEIRSELGLSEKLFNDIKKTFTTCVHLEDSIQNDDEERKFEDIIPDEKQNTEEMVEKKLLKEKIRALLGTFNDEDKYLLESRFGFNDKDILTLEEIGEELELTKEGIRLRKLKTFSSLKENLNEYEEEYTPTFN